MPFGLKTKNTRNTVRQERPIRGLNIDNSQLSIYFSIICLGIVIFFANINIIWKGVMFGLLVIMFFKLPQKFDDQKHKTNSIDYGRTFLEWFLMYIKKFFAGTSGVDRGADYSYFNKK